MYYYHSYYNFKKMKRKKENKFILIDTVKANIFGVYPVCNKYSP